MMTENKNQPAPKDSKKQGSSANDLENLSYEELPLNLKRLISLPTLELNEFLEDYTKFYNSDDNYKNKMEHPEKRAMQLLSKNFPPQDLKNIITKKWRREFASLAKKTELKGPSPSQTKQDNFNKNAREFAKNPFENDTPQSYTKQPQSKVPLVPEFNSKDVMESARRHKEENPTQKVAPINRQKAAALKIIDKIDKDNLPPQKTQPSFDPLPEHLQPTGDITIHNRMPSRMGADDESSSEDGLEPSEMVPHRVIVAEHIPYSFGIVNLLVNFHHEWIKLLAPYAWLAAWYMKIKDMILKKMTPQQIIVMHIKYIGVYFGYKFTQWLFQWLFNTFWFSYRAYLSKKKTKCYIDEKPVISYKEVLDDSRSLVRHAQHQMTDRQEANFHFYQYKFYRRYNLGGFVPVLNTCVVKPINKILRYVTNSPMAYNYRIPEMWEQQITVNDWDFPAEFEKYVTYEDDAPKFANYVIDDKTFKFRRQGKTEVVHSDLLHRLWNASTFNMMNGVEQLHSRISNVINSSNDFVMYSREAKHSAINGTKNILSYLIQERFTNDPNRNFHKGSPEFSNTGIAFSISNVPGDPRFQTSLKLIFVSLIWLEFGDGWRSLNQYKSRLESMLSNSHSHTRTSLTQSGQSWVRLSVLMQSFLSSVIQIVTGRAVAPFLF